MKPCDETKRPVSPEAGVPLPAEALESVSGGIGRPDGLVILDDTGSDEKSHREDVSFFQPLQDTDRGACSPPPGSVTGPHFPHI